MTTYYFTIVPYKKKLLFVLSQTLEVLLVDPNW